MSFYIVTGALGSGKSLFCVREIQNHLFRGLKVATNLDLYLDEMLPLHVTSHSAVRLPDLPSVDDFQQLGYGSDVRADESNFGIIVLDEASGSFNSREWADKSRNSMIDWLKHSRKYRWHVYLIIQSVSMLDKQIRDAFGEHQVVCRRTDRFLIPFVGKFLDIFGITVSLPKFHVASVKYGLAPSSPIVRRTFFSAKSLYSCYDTEQVFKLTTDGNYSFLSPYFLRGHLMSKFQLAKLYASAYLFTSFFFGFLLAFCLLMWHFSWNKNKFLNGKPLEITKTFNQSSDIDSSLSILGVMFVDGLCIAYTNDGRIIRTTDFSRDSSGLRVKVGDKWVYKK